MRFSRRQKHLTEIALVYGRSGIRHDALVAHFDDIRKIYDFSIKITVCDVLYTVRPVHRLV